MPRMMNSWEREKTGLMYCAFFTLLNAIRSLAFQDHSPGSSTLGASFDAPASHMPAMMCKTTACDDRVQNADENDKSSKKKKK